MLSDAPFTSPWSSEVLINGDYTMSVVPDTDEEDELDLCNFTKRFNEQIDNSSQRQSVSGLTTGSECSNDDLYWDGDDDGFLHEVDICHNFDGLNSNLNDVIDSAVINGLNLLDSDVSCSSSSSTESSSSSSYESSSALSDWSLSHMSIPEASQAFTCTTLNQSPKFQSCRGKNVSCKKWSSLSKCEKLKLIDELSLTIGQELGLREKMDIIKIINPAANWNKQQTEFVIDLKAVDDSKLEKIQDIVNFHCVQSSDHIDNSNTPNKKFSKRSKSRDRRPKVERQRIQKENRQKLKERRSGLFVQEEIMAVSTSCMEEEIDILG